MTTIPLTRLWTIEDVSTFLGIPVKTLYQWRTNKYGPSGKRVGRYVRYKPEDVLAWVDAADEYAS